MKNKTNIDELLKQQFSDFAPDAPNVWSGIEQGIGVSAGNIATQGAVNAGFFTTKIIATIFGALLVAGSVATYIYLQPDKKKEVAVKKDDTSVTINPPEMQKSQLNTTPQEEIQTDKGVSKMIYIVPNVIEEHVQHANKKRAISEDKTNSKSDENVQQDIMPATTVDRKQEPTTERKIESITEKAQPSAVARTQSSSQEEMVHELSKSEIEELAKLTIPNAFSPNGDGTNDNFLIVIENEEMYNLTVVDRNDKIIFQSVSKDKVWDGINPSTGEKCEAGVYAYIFRYKVKGVEKEQSKSGKLQLFR